MARRVATAASCDTGCAGRFAVRRTADVSRNDGAQGRQDRGARRPQAGEHVMLFPGLSLTIEAIGAVLLAVVIFYAVRLNRLLATLKADKAELESLVATFNQSTSRAEANVARRSEEHTSELQSLMRIS